MAFAPLASAWAKAAVGVAAALAMASACAQSYPTKPIRLVVPFPPGAYTDTVARLVAGKLSEGLSQPVVVENRAGAGGNIGAALVAKADPDGYTLLMGTIASAISVSAYADLQYDLRRDLAPVSLVVKLPYVLTVHPGVPANSIAALVELAKKKPGTVAYASSGNGSALHLATELFKARTGIDLLHVPYKGIAPAVADILAGRVSVMFPSLDAALGHIRGNKVKPLALTSAKRSALLPNVPTMAESGLPGFEIVAWGGVLAPAGTDKQIIARLNSEVRAAVGSPDIQKRFSEFGGEATPTSPEEFARFIESEIDKWADAVKVAGVKIN